jgi:hypothetical protein
MPDETQKLNLFGHRNIAASNRRHFAKNLVKVLFVWTPNTDHDYNATTSET